MKRLFFLLGLLLPLAANAQIQFTPEAGVSIYKKGTENATISPRIGLSVDYFFNRQEKGWGLMSGLYFYQKKDDYTLVYSVYQGKDGLGTIFPTESSDTWKPTNDMTLSKVISDDTYMRRDYLQLPILVKYKWQINDTYAISAAAGGYVAVGISGKHQIDEYTFLMDEKKQEYQRIEYDNPYVLLIYNRFDAGFSSRLSFQAKNLSINVSYETNLYRRNQMGHDNFISITAGYTF